MDWMLFRKAIDVDPKQADLYKMAGFTLMSGKNYDDAVEVWKDLMEHVPDDPDGPANLGEALLRLKRYPEAVDAFEKAVKLSPTALFLAFTTRSGLHKNRLCGKGHGLISQSPRN